MYCIRGTRVLLVDITRSEQYLSANFVFEIGKFCHNSGFRIVSRIPILFLYYPSLPNFSVSHYLFAYSPSIAFSLSIIVHATLVLISYCWVYALPFFKRAPLFLQSPRARILQSPRTLSQSPRARIPSPRACTPEPLCSHFRFTRLAIQSPSALRAFRTP